MFCLSHSPFLISFSTQINSPHFYINGTSLTSISFPSKPLINVTKKLSLNSSFSANSLAEQHHQEEEEEYRVITATKSEYNDIVILESQNSKVLLLDDTGNIHSILYKHQKWTNSYWDEFCSLPAIIPNGPVAIYGLGGGTVAHQLLEFWPSLVIDGWELDEILIDRARMFLGISELEMPNHSQGGILRVCIGDVLSPSASVEGGYAGIVVDLFSNGEVLPQLEVAETWLEMRDKLMPNGRIMVNCGGVKVKQDSSEWQLNFTIKALCEAFGGDYVHWKKMPENESGNYMAFTGPLPDLDLWSESVQEKLKSAVRQWKPCQL
ncbi:putative polyamine aminopropyl transferase [Bienertia sinuspersici]